LRYIRVQPRIAEYQTEAVQLFTGEYLKSKQRNKQDTTPYQLMLHKNPLFVIMVMYE
jgi:hypothetical protein